METPHPSPESTPNVRPTSVTVIGWATILASGIMILVNIMSLVSYSISDSLGLKDPLLSQYMPQSVKKVLDLYHYSQIWTGYGIVYFAFALIAGMQFLRLRGWGRKALEIACWVGLLNAAVDSWLSYMIWQNMQETLSSVMKGIGGGQYSYVNPLGVAMIILGFLMWIIPCGGMILYLRTKRIRDAVSLR